MVTIGIVGCDRDKETIAELRRILSERADRFEVVECPDTTISAIVDHLDIDMLVVPKRTTVPTKLLKDHNSFKEN